MPQKNFTLSICIPTYNRAGFLEKNLQKIAKIADPKQVEIVIADDHSEDNTKEIVENFKKKNKKFSVTYKKFGKRIFFDKMVLNVVDMARGKFCWLLGDDDLPTDTSIRKLLQIIKKHPDVTLIHLNYSRFDNVLKKVTAKRMVGSIKKDIVFDDAYEFYFKPIGKSYFKLLGTNVITMSTDIINRKRWQQSAKKIKKYIGYNFIHCFVIETMINKDPHIYYVAAPTVQYLANNHRVWPNDIWKDYNKVLLGYLEDIGYPSDKIAHMREVQSIYEKSEQAMKSPILKYGYQLAAPLIALARKIKSDLNG